MKSTVSSEAIPTAPLNVKERISPPVVIGDSESPNGERGRSLSTQVERRSEKTDFEVNRRVRLSDSYRVSVAAAPRSTQRQFIALARWEGCVVERFASYFLAEVIDLSTDERAMAEFDLDEIGIEDRSLCEPGNLFYWTIGYDVRDGGQRSRASVIRFRRLGMKPGE